MPMAFSVAIFLSQTSSIQHQKMMLPAWNTPFLRYVQGICRYAGTSATVHYRQGLDVVMTEQTDGLHHRGVRADRADIPRHDLLGAVNDMNAQIASAAEQQSAVAEEVNQNILRIRDATLHTSASSNQVAASSRELTQLAEQLKQRVAFFRF